jgi:hypothetical protein
VGTQGATTSALETELAGLEGKEHAGDESAKSDVITDVIDAPNCPKSSLIRHAGRSQGLAISPHGTKAGVVAHSVEVGMFVRSFVCLFWLVECVVLTCSADAPHAHAWLACMRLSSKLRSYFLDYTKKICTTSTAVRTRPSSTFLLQEKLL